VASGLRIPFGSSSVPVTPRRNPELAPLADNSPDLLAEGSPPEKKAEEQPTTARPPPAAAAEAEAEAEAALVANAVKTPLGTNPDLLSVNVPATQDMGMMEMISDTEGGGGDGGSGH
jgi:hypothetical protein